MNLDTTPCLPEQAPRRPSLRDLAALTTTLLPPALVMLTSLSELRRRCQEINLTHPHFCEETPLVLSFEEKRRQRLSGQLQVSGSLEPSAHAVTPSSYA
ncbi:hypothetical protein J0X19_22020 [Hymenobacter sp. BT186]|uniref:Uncharacterized protein n=1 Tax=Hymenobacter telluris TaxID=2816474 RepID=A0A939F3E2_9BACT|nr:hypothetical protein [Hymenobacter telluris]MBO0360653.1 hypothetical protein [Hymenobacter telluris]MBW3376680.1 hypothetical protein [Hymenobacter norwichensis]